MHAAVHVFVNATRLVVRMCRKHVACSGQARGNGCYITLACIIIIDTIQAKHFQSNIMVTARLHQLTCS